MKEIPFQIFRIESWSQIPDGLRAMLEDIEHRVIPAQAHGKKWDYMRIELWPDSGRFIAFPAHSEEEFRVDVTGCQLVCEEIVSDFMATESIGANLGSEVEKIYDRMVALATPAFEQLSCESFEIWDAEGIQR